MAAGVDGGRAGWRASTVGGASTAAVAASVNGGLGVDGTGQRQRRERLGVNGGGAETEKREGERA
jgi:hypothetical protein